MSSRLYRDNVIPILGLNGRPQWDEKGGLVSEPAKVRDRVTEEGKRKGVPYRLVDTYPWRVVANVSGAYNYVSERDRNIAKMIEEGVYNDPDDPHGRKPPSTYSIPFCFSTGILGKEVLTVSIVKEKWRAVLREVDVRHTKPERQAAVPQHYKNWRDEIMRYEMGQGQVQRMPDFQWQGGAVGKMRSERRWMAPIPIL